MKKILPSSRKKRFSLAAASMFVLLGCSFAHGQSLTASLLPQNSSISQTDQGEKKETSLSEVLQTLENQHSINITYRSDVLDDKYVSQSEADNLLATSKTALEDSMRRLMQSYGLSFKKYSETLYIIFLQRTLPEKVDNTPLNKIENQILPEGLEKVSGNLYASFKSRYDKTVSGKVIDLADDSPLPGVNVVVKNTTIGGVTDVEGNYRLSLPDNAEILVFSSVGYESEEIEIGNRSIINVSLSPDIQALQEIVVVGYGTQERKDLTGSVASVQGDAIKNLPVNDISGALQGRMAGVEVIRNSAEPGAGSDVIIRGVSSLRNKDPLYIVDGVRQSGNNINIQDIESIDVLKDASAASIYGAAAAGGVIVITTKKGTKGKPRVNFNGRYGLTQPLLYDLLGRDDYVRLKRSLDPGYLQGEDIGQLPNTDWVDALYSNGTEQNYNLSISGATDNSNYFVSGLYNREDGIFIDNSSELYGARLNSEFNLSSRIKVGEQLYVYQRATNPVADDDNQSNPPFRSTPLMSVYDDTNPIGGFGMAPAGFGGANYVGIERSTIGENKDFRLQGNVYAEVDLPLDLTFRTTLGYTTTHKADLRFEKRYDFGPVARNNNQLEKEFVNETRLLNNYVLTFDRSFGIHQLTALVGYEQIIDKESSVRGIQTNQALEPNFAFFPTTETEQFTDGGDRRGGGFDENGLIKSQFGRINYALADKYLLTASVRRDANFTKFGPGNQYGVFPAASVGWRISDEAFFSPLSSVVSYLKIRGSYGVLGNDNIPSYQFLSTFDLVGAQDFTPNGDRNLGYSQEIIPNRNIKWESIYQTNIGLDLEMLEGKVYATLDWYNKTTEDMLYGLPIPSSSGIRKSFFTNIGSVRNRGVELLVGYRNKVNELKYDISFNAAYNQNKVLNLDDINENPVNDGRQPSFGIFSRQSITRTQAGEPFGQFYGFVAEGIYQTDAEAAEGPQFAGRTARAGDLKFKDVNEDGELSEDDRTFIGNPNPALVYGLNLSFDWKGIDLRMLFNGVAGVDLFNVTGAQTRYLYQDGNTTDRVFEASFLGDNGLTDYPRLGYLEDDGSGGVDFLNDPNGNYTEANSFWVEDGSYLKLKNLQIGYNLPGDWLAPLQMQQARVFFMANNLFTLTRYTGLDPEIGGGRVTNRGLDQPDRYPQARYFSLGIDVTF